MYVDVILRQKGRFSDMLFSYRVPDSLENKIDVGYRVSVPFGKSNKPIEAIVNNLKSENESEGTDFEIKEIFDVLGDEPLISRENMELISWMRDRYICTYLDCLNLFFPKGYTLNSTKIVKPVFSIEELTVEQEMSLDQAERKIINELYLSKEDVSYDSLTSRHSKSKVDSLISKGLVNIQWSYKEVVNEKKIKTVYLDEDLKCKIQMDSDYINCLKLGKKQLETVNFLILNDAVEQSALLDLLGVSNQTIKSLEKKGIIKIKEESYFRAPRQFLTVENKKIDLNSQQREVVDRIIEGIREQSRKPYLIHGVTGSGKTEVFLELIEYVLSQGMESVFLVPEIALTPQTIARVKNRFGNIVGVFHSQLSEGEKYDVFREVKNGNIRVVIGTRSAIFLPFDSLGLIIIDEEHDFSYKSEKTPKYDAIEVARYKAFKSNVAVVLGSATPSVPDYYNAKNGDYELLELNKRANNNLMPEISIVDMRKELHSGNSSPLSKELVAKMDLELKKGNQVILFLNKRGYANFMECKDCGHVFKCKNCDITLTNHKSLKKGICHYCGYEEHIPERCPKCNMTNIGSVGVGTEKIEELVSNLFPNHKTLRMDRDSTKKKNGVQKILEKFNKGEADILIGTQMLSKGHDFANVTLVGIISADLMLNFPDFKSYEQTFQLITQVSGRAGRGEKLGQVVLQTYNTEHFAIRSAANYDFKGFYETEIKLRKTFGYEPFNSIIRVVFANSDESVAKENSFRFRDTLKYLMEEKGIDSVRSILGPNECSIRMINNKFRWQVIIKNHGVDIKLLKSMIKYICIKKYENVFSKGIDISIEINPNTFI